MGFSYLELLLGSLRQPFFVTCLVFCVFLPPIIPITITEFRFPREWRWMRLLSAGLFPLLFTLLMGILFFFVIAFFADPFPDLAFATLCFSSVAFGFFFVGSWSSRRVIFSTGIHFVVFFFLAALKENILSGFDQYIQLLPYWTANWALLSGLLAWKRMGGAVPRLFFVAAGVGLCVLGLLTYQSPHPPYTVTFKELGGIDRAQLTSTGHLLLLAYPENFGSLGRSGCLLLRQKPGAKSVECLSRNSLVDWPYGFQISNDFSSVSYREWPPGIWALLGIGFIEVFHFDKEASERIGPFLRDSLEHDPFPRLALGPGGSWAAQKKDRLWGRLIGGRPFSTEKGRDLALIQNSRLFFLENSPTKNEGKESRRELVLLDLANGKEARTGIEIGANSRIVPSPFNRGFLVESSSESPATEKVIFLDENLHSLPLWSHSDGKAVLIWNHDGAPSLLPWDSLRNCPLINRKIQEGGWIQEWPTDFLSRALVGYGTPDGYILIHTRFLRHGKRILAMFQVPKSLSKEKVLFQELLEVQVLPDSFLVTKRKDLSSQNVAVLRFWPDTGKTEVLLEFPPS